MPSSRYYLLPQLTSQCYLLPSAIDIIIRPGAIYSRFRFDARQAKRFAPFRLITHAASRHDAGHSISAYIPATRYPVFHSAATIPAWSPMSDTHALSHLFIPSMREPMRHRCHLLRCYQPLFFPAATSRRERGCPPTGLLASGSAMSGGFRRRHGVNATKRAA